MIRPTLSIVVAVGCTTAPADELYVPEGDLEGIEEVAEGLVDLSGRCTFATAAATLTCTMANGDLMALSKSLAGDVVVNGFKVTTAGVTATASNAKAIVVTGSGGTNTLILDLYNGTFALGASTKPSGISIDLGLGSDALKLRGSPGVEHWVYGANGISLNGDAFVDVTYTNVEQHTIALGGGNDTFSAAGDATTGTTVTHNVVVLGGTGNDTIRGGGGAVDTLSGGDGDDTFTTGPTIDGIDIMSGDLGTDTADYSLRTANLNLSNQGTADDGEPGETDNIKSDVEVVKGGSGNDIITGSANADTIFGGPGNDSIDGGLGNDTLNGDAGDDTFLEGGTIPSGADVFNGGTGIDKVNYNSRTSSVIIRMDNVLADDGEAGEGDRIGADVENATGGVGNDTITGSAGDNVLDGAGGNDTISGGPGNDTLTGGTGTDVINGDDGNDVILEGAGSNGGDTFNCGTGIDTISYALRGASLIVTMDGVADDGAGGVTEGDNVKSDCENLIGGSAGDNITGNALDNQIEGGSGVSIDTINGGAGNDVIDGGAGVDVIDCGLGEDVNLDAVAEGTNCEL